MMFVICTHAYSRRNKSFFRLLTYVCLIKGLACGEGQDEGDGGAPQAVKLSEQLQALNFEHIDADALRSVAISALSPGWGSEAPDWELVKVKPQADQWDINEEVTAARKLLGAARSAQSSADVSCSWDWSLDQDSTRVHGQKYLFAANFVNNEAVLPHIIVQLWHALALLPRDSAFVSVYESGSSDSSGVWLEKMRKLLTAMGVPHRIITDGILRREEGMDRITFLAKVRNAALEPLWQLRSGQGSNVTWMGHLEERGLGPWPATRIIFLNDVYLCAKDVIRLLFHEADMACGLDLGPNFSSNGLKYYDIWVGRDIGGDMITGMPPYVVDPYSRTRLPRGLPIPVKACWNGMVALKAEPFIEHGLRFRDNRGECWASECKLLCDDLINLGYSNIVLDPGVRFAYRPEDARRAYADAVKDLHVSSWAEVAQNPINHNMATSRPYTRCVVWADGRLHWDNTPFIALTPEV